jgi:hypothetical protein
MPIAKGDAMTAPLSAERVIELREQIRTGAVVIWSPDISGVAEDVARATERNRKNFPGLDKEVT